jgi:phosphosulfolactate synthase
MRTFLSLPRRAEKPRETGITHVLDKGLGLRQVEDLLSTASGYIDIVKFGWGTGYLTQNIEGKIAAYRAAGIATCFGGTLLELAIIQNRFDECRRQLRRLGLTHVELSTGIIELTADERHRYIRTLARDFVVFSEVGSKDAQHILAPYRWVEQTQADLAAGSWKVICEARESGTVGIYHSNGEVKAGLIEELVAKVDPGRLVFEAPLKSQQAWLVQKFGSNVNLGNIPTTDVIALETIRVGLRADTMAALFDVEGWNARRQHPAPPGLTEVGGHGRTR